MSLPTSPDPTIASAARWFWWIAGLSLVNTVLFHSGSDTNFVLGLAMTTFANVFFASNMSLALILAGFTVGVYFLIGVQAQRHKAWSFYLGLAIYLADALIYALLQDWMPVAFHALAIFFIVKGLLRLRELENSTVHIAAV